MRRAWSADRRCFARHVCFEDTLLFEFCHISLRTAFKPLCSGTRSYFSPPSLEVVKVFCFKALSINPNQSALALNVVVNCC